MTADKPVRLVPKLRFPEFRDAGGWNSTQLSSVAYFVNDRVSVSAIIKGEYVSTENILPNFAGVAPPSSFPSSGSVTRFCINDVLISNIRPYLKKVWRATRSGGASNDVLVVRNKSGTSADYLVALLQSDIFIDYVMGGAKGVKMPRGDIGLMKQYPVGMPKLAEQQKIADCLGSLDDLIAAEGRKLETLRQHKQGLVQQLFPQEDESVPRLRFPEFRSAIEWSRHKFGDFVVRSFYGTSASTSETGQFPVLRMGNMVDGRLDFSNLVYIDLDLEEFESYRLQKGDILLNRTNSRDLVGKVSIFDLESEYITASYIVSFRLDENRLDPWFCNMMLNTQMLQSRIKLLATPSISQANINPTTFRTGLDIVIPELAEQKRIAACLSSLNDVLAAQSRKVEALTAHKQSLLQQLFPSLESQ